MGKHSTDRSALVNPTWRHHHPQIDSHRTDATKHRHFQFELTDEDMATIATLDMGYSLFLIIMMLEPPICLWNRDKIILL